MLFTDISLTTEHWDGRWTPFAESRSLSPRLYHWAANWTRWSRSESGRSWTDGQSAPLTHCTVLQGRSNDAPGIWGKMQRYMWIGDKLQWWIYAWEGYSLLSSQIKRSQNRISFVVFVVLVTCFAVSGPSWIKIIIIIIIIIIIVIISALQASTCHLFGDTWAAVTCLILS